MRESRKMAKDTRYVNLATNHFQELLLYKRMCLILKKFKQNMRKAFCICKSLKKNMQDKNSQGLLKFPKGQSLLRQELLSLKATLAILKPFYNGFIICKRLKRIAKQPRY